LSEGQHSSGDVFGSSAARIRRYISEGNEFRYRRREFSLKDRRIRVTLQRWEKPAAMDKERLPPTNDAVFARREVAWFIASPLMREEA
jgi:hypothetical protein